MKTRHLVESEAIGLLEQFPGFDFSSERLPELRALHKKMMLQMKSPLPPGLTARRTLVPGLEGEPDVSLLVYSPDKPVLSRGALLCVHGGGYVMGDAEGESPWFEWLATELNCVVVAPDYRLAPETPHPGPVTDCYAGLKWLYDQSESLGVDRKRIGVYGGSAGGGLAAAVALLARDRNEVPLCFQCLLYPMLDDRTTVRADPNPFAGEYAWTPKDNYFGWASLLGHEPGRLDVSPYASPARASDLAGLPPTFIWVGALDLFVDESIEYARRLVRAGVPTELRVYPGVTHGNAAVPDAPSTKLSRLDTIRVLKKALSA